MITTRAREQAIAEAVLQAILDAYGFGSPAEALPWLDDPQPAPRYEVADAAGAMSAAAALRSPAGRFRLRVDIAGAAIGDVHPMIRALRAAEGLLRLGQEIEHPLERDPRDVTQPFEGVMTVRTVPQSGIALSSDAMPLHQDGLGSAGSIRFVAMCLDSGPSTGGTQLYSNVLAHGLALAHENWERFVEATRVDALTVTRHTGKQHASVTGPLFYLDESGLPAAHFRGVGGEYAITPNPDVARWFGGFADRLAESAQVEQLEPGDGIVVDNLAMAHARDAFAESDGAVRRLSRKWYAIRPDRTAVWAREPFRLDPAVYGSGSEQQQRESARAGA